MFDVFISYKSEERSEALHIKNFLQANGLECWMDQNQIQIGQDYKKQIAEVMPKCKSLILLISYVSQNSQEVTMEYELAVSNKLKIFPVKIEDCKLSEYYDSKLRHTQIAKEFWKSEQEKQKILCSIRDQLYELKGEEIKTAEDFLNMRVGYYQKKLNEEFIDLEKKWDDVIRKSLERCGFMTPEPHFIQAVLIDAVHQYQDLISTYIEDIIGHTEDNEYIEKFCDFISNNDIITSAWRPFDQFAKLVIRTLGIDGESDDERAYILRIFKDYISTLNGSPFQHPIVRIAQRLRQVDRIRYENLISHLFYNWQQPSFIDKGNSLIFISPRYIGEEYVNIGGRVYIDDHRAVFNPRNLSAPEACDFLRKFVCDVFIENLNATGGAAEISSFFIENALFACDNRFNYMYFYLIFKLIETRKPEYVKIVLRNFGKINWNIYTDNNAKSEIATLKRFYYCCMIENGYEVEYIHKLWKEA